MKKGLLVLAALVMAASAWGVTPWIGGTVPVKVIPNGGGVFIPTDTLQYHTIFRDNYVNYWNPPRLYPATRFSPPYTGTIDSATIVVYVNGTFTVEDTLFFYKDTLSPRQPGRRLAGYLWSNNYTGRNIYLIKIRLGTAFPITQGTDFWAGWLGMVAPVNADTLWTITDTTFSSVPDRQWVKFNGTWYRCDAIGVTTDWGISLFANTGSGVELLTPGGPVSLSPKLYPASPNPFRGSGEIAFDLPKAARVELTVYDLAGRLVRALVVGETSAGHHSVRWDGKDVLGRPVASGVYLYTLRAGDLSATRSLVIVR